jgi:DNA primase
MSDLDEIKSRLDVIDVISEYVPLKKSGQNWKGLCPFHAEKTPSFTVSPSKQIYYCFGCSSGGDIFTFLMKHESLSFQESLTILAKKAGVSLKKTKQTGDTGEKEALVNVNREAALFYEQCLSRNSSALEYLGKRGVTSDVQKIFSLGFSPKQWDALISHLQRKHYKPEKIKKAGLAVHGTRGYYDTFRNRIIFPIFNLRGEVIAFGGRVMDDSLPKYLNSPETPVFNKSGILYGLNLAKDEIRKRGFAIFVEGYLDVIAAHKSGFTNTVAPLGTAITREHGQLIKRFTEEIVIVFDGDESGFKAARNGMAVLLESGLNVRVLAMPRGEDPDSFLKKEGEKAFSRLLDNALSLVDFFVKYRKSGVSQKGDDHFIIREVLQTVSKIPYPALQGYYVKTLSEALNINEIFVREQLMKIRKKPLSQKESPGQDVVPAESKPRPMDEMYLLQLVLQFPDRAERVFHTISMEDLQDPEAREIFKKMKKGFVNYEELVLNCDEEEKRLLTELMFRADIENPDKVLDDCAKRLYNKKRQTLLHELQHKIKKAEREKDDTLLRTLLQEKQKQLRFKG